MKSVNSPALLVRNRRGFALIITVLLMALLVLIVVSFAALTRVEIQIATNSQQVERARQNAMTALTIALGQLQAAAGPDQRITARAEILDAVPDSAALTGVNQPHWTGVWKTGPANPDIIRIPGSPDTYPIDKGQRFISTGETTTMTRVQKVAAAADAAKVQWLVSKATPTTPVDPLAGTFTIAETLTGEDKLAADQSGVTTAASGAIPTAVMLAKNLGRKDPSIPYDAATNVGYVVAAPLVDLTAPVAALGNASKPIGRYAFWVSDEGVKAKVNIKDPTLNSVADPALKIADNPVDAVTDLAKNQLHFAAPQAMAGHKVLSGTLAVDFRQNSRVERVLTPQQLPLLPAAAPTGYVGNRHLADLTTYSYGVLADVRNGGLRKDLTAAFEDTGATPKKNYHKFSPTSTANVYSIYVPLSSPPSGEGIPLPDVTQQRGVFNGLRWLNLYYYYNLYKSALPTVDPTKMGVVPTAKAVPPVGIGDPSQRPYSVSMHVLGWSQTSASMPTYAALTPICLGARWDVALSAEFKGGGYVPRLHYYPQLVLYNPYTVAIKSSYYNFGRDLTALMGASFTYQDRVTLDIGTKSYFAPFNQSARYGALSLTTNGGDSSDFAPGEIRVYGLASTNNVPVAEGPYLNASDAPQPNSINIACQFPYQTTSDGLVSKNYNPTMCNVTDMLYNKTAFDDVPSHTVSKTDYYAVFPPQADAKVTISLSRYTTTGSTNVVIVPRKIFWPYIAKPTEIDNPAFFNPTQALMLTNTPGTYDTGFNSGPTSTWRAGGKPFPAEGSYGILLSDLAKLATNPVLLWSLSFRTKGLKGEASGYSNCIAHIPAFMGNTEGFNTQNDMFSSWTEAYVRDPSTQWGAYDFTNLFDMNLGDSPSANPGAPIQTTSWGNRSVGVDPVDPASPAGVVLAEVPLQPLVSLGQFMHLRPSYAEDNGQLKYSHMGFGTMFTGGSYANPSVPLSATVYDTGPLNGYQKYKSYLFCDNSFLANQALFDAYYFSTVPPASLTAPVAGAPDPLLPARASVYPKNWVDFNAKNKGATLTDASTPFLNSRMVPYRKNGVAPDLTQLRDMDTAAANLLLNGAFNINSTSIDAWRVLLSSLSGNDLSLWNVSTQSTFTFKSADLLNPIPRFWSATGNANLNTAWCGVRALTDTEVTELATKIVAQVKLRGPFLSLADFLNRRLGASPTDLALTSPLTLSGALQAAIDTTAPDINKTSKDAGEEIVVPPLTIRNPENMRDATLKPWNTATGIPGYLMQQDLVQAFSPVMAARSDTFVIRTYGETVNPVTLKVEAKAYCEAVVQRLPDFLDQNDLKLTAIPTGYAGAVGDATPLASLTAGSINEKFGRRFKIISFRWLSPHDL